MSFIIEVDTSEVEWKLDAILNAVPDGILAGAIHVKGKVAEYPPQAHLTRASVYGQSFVSDKQRRWFFAVGIHQTPYRRTSTLAKNWSINQTNNGWTAIIDNNTPYGHFVQGSEDQSLYHRAQGWKRTDEVAQQERENVIRMVIQAIEKAIG